jgi:type IV pilus assembly protein PilC
MPTTYGYKVRDREGKLLGGSLEAESEEAVIGRLRQLGYTPLSIEAEKGAGLKTELRLPGTGRVKLKDLAIFSRQFATMINSGLSLLRALTILGEQTANRRLGEVVGQIRAEVETGMSLSAAMAKHPKIFNRLYVSMVRAGEIGGFLDQVLVKVAETFEKEVALRGKIRSAMTYPVVVFVMVMAGLAFAYKRWRATPAGRYRLDQFKLKVKVFGPLFHKSALSRFARPWPR